MAVGLTWLPAVCEKKVILFQYKWALQLWLLLLRTSERKAWTGLESWLLQCWLSFQTIRELVVLWVHDKLLDSGNIMISVKVSSPTQLFFVSSHHAPPHERLLKTESHSFPFVFPVCRTNQSQITLQKWHHFSREKQHASQFVGDAIAWESMDRATPKKIVNSGEECCVTRQRTAA